MVTIPPNRGSRVRGAMLGLLIGDAVGVPYEFKTARQIPPLDRIDMIPPPGYARTYAHIPPGTWSDDGAQALCLLASLLHCQRFDEADFAARLVRWMTDGYMAVDGEVFDIGNTTQEALSRIQRGVPPAKAGSADEASNGNGALMRVLPLALWHAGSDAELVRDARHSSRITHAHLRSQVCCALYCLWARRILQNHSEPWADAIESLRRHFEKRSDEAIELNEVILGRDANLRGGTGYVVDALHSARWACAQGNYEVVIRAAVSLGNDTDTTACIAGGIAGLTFGQTGIPARWIRQLRNVFVIEDLLLQWP